MKITAYVASAFSKNHEGGNKAGVVFMTQPLTRTQKMAIAKELGFAETAFISDSKIADFRLEYFTPKEEVDLCGHATIGAFTIMKHLNNYCKQNIQSKRTAVCSQSRRTVNNYLWNKLSQLFMIRSL